ncbi:MAG TPA: PBP1A family penicillin-binding protein [Thermoanaerobaculia bacterium]|nr:PBP1A family penicillin-binding protein [Thermoanaerobaculia bacterium]
MGLLSLLPFLPLAVVYQRCGLGGCPEVSRLGAFQPDGSPVVLDRHGERFAELRLADRLLVKLDELPAHVPEAFIAVEDQRFLDHRGVDWRRVAGATLANLKARSVIQGSSTITMQLARNVFSDEIPGQDRTLWRKLLEVRVGREIEDSYDKDEILELYLNYVFFGGGARGIEAASRQYFGHPATELTVERAALLAALLKAPTRYDPRRHPERARERRDLVLTLMARQGRISAEDEAAAREAPLGVLARGGLTEVEPAPAPYFVEQVRRELETRFGDSLYRRPLRVVTSLDFEVQRAMEEALERQLGTIERGAWGRFTAGRYSVDAEVGDQGTPYLQGAAVALDARTGDVLAWVGGRDFDHSQFDRVSQARRQIGSAFKPFVYTAALAEGHPPSELVSDRPVAVDLGHGQIWQPRNFEGRHQEAVTLRQALVSSHNAATVRIAQAVGFARVADYAERLGFAGDLPRRPSLALGTAVASPLELTTAYTPFATLGTRVEPRLILRIESPDGEVLWESAVERREIVDPGLAYLVTDMMRDVVDRGTGHRVRQAGFRGTAAGKTGTTNEGFDAWFVGFTPEIVAGVWIGFDRPRAILSRTSGGLLAAPVWGRAMREVYRHRPAPGAWPRPIGVIEARVDPASGRILAPGCEPLYGAATTDIFLAGLTPSTVCPHWIDGEEGERGFLARVAEWGGSFWELAQGEEEAGAEGDHSADLERGPGTIEIRPSRPGGPAASDAVTEGFEAQDFDFDRRRRLRPPTAPAPEDLLPPDPTLPPAPPQAESPVLPIPEGGPPAETPGEPSILLEPLPQDPPAPPQESPPAAADGALVASPP